MRFTKTGHSYVIKIEQGEELVGALTAFCIQQNIQNAHFSGIGAASFVSCGYYALDEKKYYFTEYKALVEVVSLTGNVALKEGKPFVHVHGIFTDTKNQAFGGHIEKVTAGIVIEVVLTQLDSKVERELDAEIGLYLFNCEN